MTHSQIKASVMRRVYYSYALSLVSHPMFWHGVLLSVAAALLARWLHVASIINNFLAVPVGQVPRYTWNSLTGAISHGELMTVLVLLAAGGLTLSVSWRLLQSLPIYRGHSWRLST